jgi:hypothetical protein
VYVRAAVIDDGTNKALIVVFDLLFHSPDLFEDVQKIAASHGIDPENVVVSYTHSHNSPASMGYDNVNASAEYEIFLRTRVADCIARATVCMFEGIMEYGIARGEWSVNRRIPKNGKMAFGPNPDGVIDDRLDVIAVRDATGKIRGFITGYGCHPVHYSNRTMMSAEYPGRLCNLLETAEYGCTAIFAQTTGGNARPKLSNKAGGFQQCSYEELDEMAASMAKAVTNLTASCRSMKPVDLSISGRSFTVRLDMERMPLENFEAVANNPSKPLLYQINSKYIVDHFDTVPDYMDLRCGLIRLSEDFCIAHMGGEPCFEVKFLVEKALDGVNVFFEGYTDACLYIATDKLLAEGGYEADGCYIEYCVVGPLKQGVDAKLTAAFRKYAMELELKIK